MKIIKSAFLSCFFAVSVLALPVHSINLNIGKDLKSDYVQVSASTGVWDNNHCDSSGMSLYFKAWINQDIASYFPESISFDIFSEDLDGVFHFPTPNGAANCVILQMSYQDKTFVDEFMYDIATKKAFPNYYNG